MRYQLEKGEIVTLVGSDAVQAVLVQSGRVWLTRQGDPRDYCLEAGSRLPCGGAGTLVLEALEDSALAVIVAEPQARACSRVTLAFSCPGRRQPTGPATAG